MSSQLGRPNHKAGMESDGNTGVTVFLADQNVRFCQKVADRGYIIEKGTIQYQDEMKNILENEEIVKKYLTV